MSSVYERDYVTVPESPTRREPFRTQAELEAASSELQAQMKAAAANLEFEKAAALRDRIKQLQQPRARAGREPALSAPWLETWVEGARSSRSRSTSRMLGKVARGVVTPPFYYRDIIEQFDAIGVGSLTVVLLTGLFTGMVLALQSGHHARSVRRALDGRPAGQRVDGQGARARC